MYQTAVHDDYQFLSFKKVLFEMTPTVTNIELVSILLYSGGKYYLTIIIVKQLKLANTTII